MTCAATRRAFLGTASAALAFSRFAASAEPVKRPKVAAVFTGFTYRSHAHVILENFLEPYIFNGKRTDPGVGVVSFYADQKPKSDISAEVEREYKIPVFKTIDEALCLGGKELAVDAVLAIGEHGQYPKNKLGQHEYPRSPSLDDRTI